MAEKFYKVSKDNISDNYYEAMEKYLSSLSED
jgi:hypothetical protein